MEKKKYIIYKNGSVEVFDVREIHSWRAGSREVVSAGFVSLENGEYKMCFGESKTLGVKSRPEDINLLDRKIESK